MLEILELALSERGYEQVEPGVWQSPDQGWTDHLLEAVQDCLERGV